MTNEEIAVQFATMQAELAKLKAENAKLKSVKTDKGLSIRVSPKGAISVYGLSRFPCTLYKSQWDKLLADESIASIKKFIEENAASIAVKPVAE